MFCLITDGPGFPSAEKIRLYKTYGDFPFGGEDWGGFLQQGLQSYQRNQLKSAGHQDNKLQRRSEELHSISRDKDTAGVQPPQHRPSAGLHRQREDYLPGVRVFPHEPEPVLSILSKYLQ